MHDIRSNGQNHVTIGPHKLILSRLSDESISELDSYVQKKIVEVADKASKDLSPEARDLAMSHAIKQASYATFFSTAGAHHIGTPDGMAFLLYQLSRDNNKGITPDELKKEMFDYRNVDKVNAEFARLHNLSNHSKKKKRREENQRKREKKKRKKKNKQTIKRS